MNELHAPFSDHNVRLAMNYAVNKQAYFRTVSWVRARNAFPRWFTTRRLRAGGNVPLRSDEGSSVLAEAGYPNGFTTTLWALNDTFSQKEAVFLQQQFAQISVKVVITPMEAGILDSSSLEGPDTNKGQLILNGFSPSNGAIQWILQALVTRASWPPAFYNLSFYSNPRVDMLLEHAGRSTSTTQRDADYKQVQELVFQDATFVWLAEPTNLWGMSTRISNAYVLPDQTVQVQDAQMH